MSFENKQEIIDKHERGVHASDLVRQYDWSSSMICTILKQKAAIKTIKLIKGVTVLSKLMTSIMRWRDFCCCGYTTRSWREMLSQRASSLRRRCLSTRTYNVRQRQQKKGRPPGTHGVDFKANHGWFEKFKKRTGIPSVVWHGEAASADT